MELQLLKDIDDLKAAAAVLDVTARSLAEAIAKAPIPRTFKVRLAEEDHEISEREALTFAAAGMVAILSRKPIEMKLLSGKVLKVDVGEIYTFSQAILTQAAV